MGQVGYLVAVEELLRDEQLDKRAWAMLDETRQRRADRFKVKGARAECIGAGLLILYFGQIGQGAEHRIKGDSQENQEHLEHVAPVIRITARELLKVVEANKAAGYQGLTCKVAEHGKPYFVSAQNHTENHSPEDTQNHTANTIHFNISHSGEYVFGVLSDAEVGVDIQKCEGYKDHGIEDSYFHENEKRMFEDLPEEDRAQLFFELWVKKESYGKLTGNGIPETISMDTSEKEKEVHWLKYQGPADYAIMSCEKRK